MQGKVYYLDFGMAMISDIKKCIDQGFKVSVGYDGDVKLWYVKPKK